MNDISTMNKVMEYMTLEKPVVQFDLTEGRASAGDASLYARANDPADFAAKLAVLIRDPGLRARMGQAGRARVLERLSWDHSVPHLLAAYDRIFGRVAARGESGPATGPTLPFRRQSAVFSPAGRALPTVRHLRVVGFSRPG
jgi:hypothetical protein